MSDKPLSAIQGEAIEILKDGPLTCTELGERLWGDKARTNRGPRQSWARPAGKVMKSLKNLGLAECAYDRIREHFTWRLT